MAGSQAIEGRHNHHGFPKKSTHFDDVRDPPHHSRTAGHPKKSTHFDEVRNPPHHSNTAMGRPPKSTHFDEVHNPPHHSRTAAGHGGATARHAAHQAGRGGKQPHAARRPRSGCYNPEVRKGVGAVLFALGVPTAVAGVVMTVVAATDDDHNGKYPPAFAAVGPVLLACAFLLFLAGFSLYSPIMSNVADQCCSLDDPSSLCRVYCPRISHCLKPDPSMTINRAALDALKTEPGKSVLKRKPGPPNPTTAAVESDKFAQISTIDETVQYGSIVGLSTQPSGGRPMSTTQSTATAEGHTGSKGVSVPQSDIDRGPRRPRALSATSDSSLVSLRHCKIHPKDDGAIWWTDDLNNVFHGDGWQGGVKEQMITEL